MTESRATTGYDRLPWLNDDEPPRSRPLPVDRRLWSIAALIAITLIVSIAFWIGIAGQQQSTFELPQAKAPLIVNAVPLVGSLGQAADADSPIVEPSPVHDVVPSPAPPMPEIATGPAMRTPTGPARRLSERPRRAVPARTTTAHNTTAPTPLIEKPVEEEAAEPAIPQLWPVRVHDGASGRLVQVGAFATQRQAKKGWWAIVKVNPSLKRLPALVIPAQSARNGRTYYRLQMGTTSQAHSTVLCQKMRIIGQSCIVIEIANRGGGITQL